MPKFKVEFTRSVREFHEAIVEADNETAVMKLYEEGEIFTTVVDSKIDAEEEPDIEEIPRELCVVTVDIAGDRKDHEFESPEAAADALRELALGLLQNGAGLSDVAFYVDRVEVGVEGGDGGGDYS